MKSSTDRISMIEKIWEGELLESRVIIWDKEAVALYDEAGYGKPLPEDKPDRIELELAEAAYLVEKEKLKVFEKQKSKKKKLSFDDLIRIGNENVNQFHTQFLVFRDLRERGYVVKTGFKFGAQDPEKRVILRAFHDSSPYGQSFPIIGHYPVSVLSF